MSTAQAPDESTPRDQGLTLVEVLVAMTLFGAVGTILLGFALGTAAVTDRVKTSGALTGESRVAMERMARELRQASTIKAVQFSTSTSTTTAITFWTDFDGDGVEDTGLSDPEVLTYRWDPSSKVLTLTADDASGTATTRPILAATVTEFELQLRSSLWQYDTTGDGVPTTWQQLDAAGPPVGDKNGIPDAELKVIDLVAVHMSVLEDGQRQTYDFQADLRNMAQS